MLSIPLAERSGASQPCTALLSDERGWWSSPGTPEQKMTIPKLLYFCDMQKYPIRLIQLDTLVIKVGIFNYLGQAEFMH